MPAARANESYKAKNDGCKQLCSRRCSQCGYDESATAGTLFHKLKFSLLKAFEMVYEITTSKKGGQ